MQRVAVTGIGCVSGLGQGYDDTWRRALAGDGAIAPITLPRDTELPTRATGPAAIAGPLTFSSLEARYDRRSVSGLDPLTLFTIVAAEEALTMAGLYGDPVLETRTAILVGCGSGGNATFEAAYRRLFERGLDRLHPQTVPTAMISAPGSQLSMLLGARGPTMTIASACASSAHAIGEAMQMIRAGRVDAAIAGGAEACLTLGSFLAWQSLGAMADDTCRPFATGRRGMALGEGAAMLVLEEWDRAAARGAMILGELTGYAAASDAHHITAPDAGGMARAIRLAHEDAGLSMDASVLFSAHGTGTPLNDAAEAAAMRDVYGASLDRSTVIATKSAHGHLIGGSGALELAIGLRALAERVAPPTLNVGEIDPACRVPLALEATPIDHDHLVSPSFAFGGLDAVLVARRP